MPPATLLKITTSINGDHSISNGLAKTFVDTFLEKAPDTIVVERDLNKLPVAFLNVESVYGTYKPEDQRSESEKAQIGPRLELAQELLGASDVVIATPTVCGIGIVLQYLKHILMLSLCQVFLVQVKVSLLAKKLSFLYHKEEPMDQALARKAGTI